MDHSPLGSSVHGILQERILEISLQGIFLTQGLNPHLLWLLHCKRILLPLSHQEAHLIGIYIQSHFEEKKKKVLCINLHFISSVWSLMLWAIHKIEIPAFQVFFSKCHVYRPHGASTMSF